MSVVRVLSIEGIGYCLLASSELLYNELVGSIHPLHPYYLEMCDLQRQGAHERNGDNGNFNLESNEND